MEHITVFIDEETLTKDEVEKERRDKHAGEGEGIQNSTG